MHRDLRSFPGQWRFEANVCRVAAAVIGSAVVGAGASAYAANKGAKAQTKAANQANQTLQQTQSQIRQDLLPYNEAGQAATQSLNRLLGLSTGGGGGGGSANISAPDWSAYMAANPDIQAEFGRVGSSFGGDPAAYAQWHYQNFGQSEGRQLPMVGGVSNGTGGLTAGPNAIQASLESLPGYQFARTQGLKATQNAAAARGLGVSGAALKGAAKFATGLADQTYGDQVNRLQNVATMGQNAAAQTGSMATTNAGNIANNITGIGNAQAASNIAMGNAASSAANTIGNLAMTNAILKSNGGTGIYGARQ